MYENNVNLKFHGGEGDSENPIHGEGMKVALRMAQKNLIIYRTMNGPNFSFHSKITVSQQSYEV